MKRIRIMGLGLLAAVAVSAVTAVSAAAAPPELGRCVLVKAGTGEFKGPKCLIPAEGKGNHNWVPGAEKKKFTNFYSEPVLTLKGTSVTKITCAFGEAEGEYTGPKTQILKKVQFQKCEHTPAKSVQESYCQNVGEIEGIINANELAGELGFIEHKEKTKVGVDLKPVSGSVIASFECGGANEITEHGMGTGTLMELTGSVIGKVTKINRPVTENPLTYAVKAGKQSPEEFESGLPDTLTMLVGLSKTAEPVTLAGVDEVVNEEALEIKTL